METRVVVLGVLVLALVGCTDKAQRKCEAKGGVYIESSSSCFMPKEGDEAFFGKEVKDEDAERRKLGMIAVGELGADDKRCGGKTFKQSYEAGSQSVGKEAYEESLECFQKSCEGGYAVACTALGHAYEFAQGVDKSTKKANELYLKAADLHGQYCEGGALESCVYLGVAYGQGQGVAVNEKHAVKLYQKACDGDNAWGCGALGECYRWGTGVPKDEKVARELYEKACKGGHETSCVRLKSWEGGKQ